MLIILFVVYAVIFNFTKNHYVSFAVFGLLIYLLYKFGKGKAVEEIQSEMQEIVNEQKLRQQDEGIENNNSKLSDLSDSELSKKLDELKALYDEQIKKEKESKKHEELREKLTSEYETRKIEYSSWSIIFMSLEDIQKELERFYKKDELRDSETQEKPYKYEVGQHANEALAIRYGIVNNKKTIEKGYVYERGGEKVHAPEKDRTKYVPSKNIRLRKLKKLEENKFEVELTEFGNRKAVAIHEIGTEYIKTFYPLDESWFEEQKALELVLKNNGAFTLKELAKFHVDAIIRSNKG